jgi:restriction system protein
VTRIEARPPGDWRALQTAVARILAESGFRTSVDLPVQLARGSANVDVFATDSGSAPATTMIVECKLWRRRVPRQAVHALRAVVADAGANVGLLVSTAGFQKGAIEAAAYSNVQLLDWGQFEQLYLDRWVESFFRPTLRAEADPLIEYTEPLNTRIFRKADRLPPAGQEAFIALREKHSQLALGLIPVVFSASMTPTGWKPHVPLRDVYAARRVESGLPDEVLDADSLRGLVDTLTTFFRAAIGEFDGVFGGRA